MNPFTAFAQVTLDGSGSGSVRLAPVGRNWRITSLSVNVSTNVAEAECTVCANQIGPLYIVDGTTRGSTGDTSDTVHIVRSGYCLWVTWSGGDPGSQATVTIAGDEEIL